MEQVDYLNNFLDLRDALSDTFHREIDLLEDKAIRNPVPRISIYLSLPLNQPLQRPYESGRLWVKLPDLDLCHHDEIVIITGLAIVIKDGEETGLFF